MTRSVRASFAPGCGPGPASLGLSLEALGDFEATPFTTESAPGDAAGAPLTFPERTRAVSALAQGGGLSWLGIGEAGGDADIDVLLWRRDSSCIAGDVGDEPRGAALGVLPGHALVLVAGSLVASADAARAFTLDLRTGEATEVVAGMLPGRAFASVTAFGEGALLVAGGVDPSASGGDLGAAPASDSATLFDAASRRFDRSALIPLSQPRARHGAVVLASGETLLVGGDAGTGVALPTMEAVSPTDRASRVAGLATLAKARVSPTVLRLDDDRIFVGGGTSGGAPVPSVEWLAPDASSVSLVKEGLVVSAAPAFVALGGGGVLAVGVCAGCAASDVARKVAWIRPDGALDALPDLPTTPDSVALVAASDGSPWLLARQGSSRSWRRFDAWTGLFDVPLEQPAGGPDADLSPPLAVEPGLFLWLERATGPARLVGFRHDVRGRYARDIAPLLLADRQHVGPSRAPLGLDASGIEYGTGGLGLSRPDALAWITDATYADVTVNVALTSGQAPALLLGSATCRWPDGDANELRAVRRGTRAVLSRGGDEAICAVPSGRVAVGLGGPESGASRVRSLTVRRK